MVAIIKSFMMVLLLCFSCANAMSIKYSLEKLTKSLQSLTASLQKPPHKLAFGERSPASSSGQIKPFLEYNSKDKIVYLQISPKGNLVAIAFAKNAQIILWDIKKNTQQTLTGKDGDARTISFSPDGTLIAVGGESQAGGGWVYVWNAADGKSLYQFDLPQGVRTVMFAPKEPAGSTAKRLLAASTDGMARIWSLDEKAASKVISPLVFGKSPQEGIDRFSLATFNHAGTQVATAGSDSMAQLWDAATGKEIATSFKQEEGAAYKVLFSHDDQWFAFIIRPSKGIKLSFYNLLVPGEYDSFSIDGYINKAVFSPAKQTMLVATSEKVIQFYSERDAYLNADKIEKSDLLKEGVIDLSYSHDGKYIGFINKNNTAFILNEADNQILLKLSPTAIMQKILFNNNATQIITRSDYGVQVWGVNAK